MNDPVILPKGTYVGQTIREAKFGQIITSETSFREGHSSEWHYHQCPHFSHIINGGSREIRESYSHLQYAGKGLYYFPGVAHQNTFYQADTRIFNIEIENDFFTAHDLSMPPESLMFENSIPLNCLGILSILKEHRWNDHNSRIAIEQLCVNIIVQSNLPVKNYPEWASKIREVIYDHWNSSLSLSEFAACVDIHPVTLSKYFSKYYACNLGEYLRKIKIDRALELIRVNKLTLTEIAYQSGFSDQSHFTKTFYAQTGMLPKHYRNI